MVVGTFTRGCQVAVIGGGPAGYLAAIRLAQLKKDVILIEKSTTLGGICLNEGCIPSKALLHAADLIEEIKLSKRLGISVGKIDIDLPQLITWKDSIVKKLTDGVRFLVTKNGADIITGSARFQTNRTLEVISDEGPITIEFEQAVIATGSSPKKLEGVELDREIVIGPREALSLKSIPGKLLVIGAGYIGLELASVFRRFGSDVDLVDSNVELLEQHDPEVKQLMVRRLKKLGINLFLGHSVTRVEKDHPLKITLKDENDELIIREADVVLVAIGHNPNTSQLELENANIETNQNGFIEVNNRLETNVTGIYAVGDVTGPPLLAHKAYRQANVVAEIISGEPAAYDNVVIPAVVYTDPELAWAGLTEIQAKNEGYDTITGSFPFRASGRAMTLNVVEGFVKTIADKNSKQILGITIVGKNASELISEAALAIEMGAFLDDLSQTIHPHPTMSESLMESVSAALGQAIHIINK